MMTEEEYFYAQEAEALHYAEQERFSNETTPCLKCNYSTFSYFIVDDFDKFRAICEECKTEK